MKLSANCFSTKRGTNPILEHDRQNSDYVVQCWGALRGRSEKAVD